MTGVALMDGGLSAVVDFGSGPDFDACFPGLYRHAYRVAYRLTGSTEEAEDLAQEALARAFGRWASVTTFAEPAAWVTRVTTNLAFDILRRRRLGRRAPVPSAMPGPNAEHLDLYRALAALPRRQRQVVVLRYLADQSEEATAAALGCSVGTPSARGLLTPPQRPGVTTLLLVPEARPRVGIREAARGPGPGCAADPTFSDT